MGGPEYPSLSVEDVVFAEATPRQRTLAWELNGASWAPPMSMEAYVGREQTLSETTLSADGGTRYWVLHHRDDPERIVSGCETTTKEALVTDSGGGTNPGADDTTGGGVRLVKAYSVASVFTNPAYRGRGLAGFMLKKAQQVLDQGGMEFGALYSDIGRQYYTGLGWLDFPSPQATVVLGDGFDTAKKAHSDVAVKLVDENDVRELCERDIGDLKTKFETLEKKKDGKTYVTFLPSFVQCAWHFARDAYVGKAMLGREVQHRGAVTEDGASWLYWDHDFREKKLKILRVVTSSTGDEKKNVADVKALGLAAIREAQDWGLPKVLIWSPSEQVCAALTNIWRDVGDGLTLVFDERHDGSIPSLRWKGGKDLGNVVWDDNEYFSWC